ncbi:membrane progestin receptor beta-like [Ylistrum balloti]|uniref:membrane progestin receptor beta-like n=1 Tax=Ylistrum balloti TaxID=509963 RepID=UPI002905DFB7|nr:membrane progestin receptor beta-like [Ylistrum balloti]
MASGKDATYNINNFCDYIRTSFSEFLKLQPTLHRDEVHRILHEPAIIRYYRPTNQPWRYYLISLFQIHNETVNVWTHLIGFIILWWIMGELSAEYDVWTEIHSWPMLVFGLCCVISTMTSACVHLLHSRSVYHHYSLFMIDYVGATVYSFGSGIQAFYACSDKATYEYVGSNYLPLLTFMSWLNFIVLCLSKLLFGHNPCDVRRKLMMIAMMTIQAALVTLPFGPRYFRCYVSDTCSLSSLNHLTISWIFFASCAFFFGSHLPEKLYPGKCDVLGQGHQIFHVVSVVNQIWQFHSMRLDLSSGASDHTDPDIVIIMVAFSVLLTVDIVSYVLLKKLIPSFAKEEKQS